MAETIHAACLQLCSTDSVHENLDSIQTILDESANEHFDLVLLPENATLISSDTKLKFQTAQKASYPRIFELLGQLAKKHRTWLVAGSMLIQDENHPQKMFNHCPVFSPAGKLVCSYDKIHLFDADLDTESWQESAQISAGTTTATVTIDTNWKVGLSICYDLRFPELYRSYSREKCNIMTVPASFTVPTGRAHWEVLLRARAIENQCYILAAGQVGLHRDGRKTYGHSMIIDPWGTVKSQLHSGQGLISATLSLPQLHDLQAGMPVLQHRRLK